VRQDISHPASLGFHPKTSITKVPAQRLWIEKKDPMAKKFRAEIPQNDGVPRILR
jgi:hypothetical protein